MDDVPVKMRVKQCFGGKTTGELLKKNQKNKIKTKKTPNSPVDINAEISSDGSRFGLCWVGFTQHNPASLHHTFAFPHLNTQMAFRRTSQSQY